MAARRRRSARTKHRYTGSLLTGGASDILPIDIEDILFGTSAAAPVSQLVAPIVTSTAGTTQAGSRNAQAGVYANAASVVTTLLRLGQPATQPTSIGALNAKDVFWVRDRVTGRDGTVKDFLSAPHEIDNNTVVVSPVIAVRFAIKNRNNGEALTNGVTISGFAFWDSDGTNLLAGATASHDATSIGHGDFLTVTSSPDYVNGVELRSTNSVLNVDFALATSSSKADGGSCAFSPEYNSYGVCVGDFDLYFNRGAGWVLVASYDAGAGWTYNQTYGGASALQPVHSVPSAGALSLSSLSYDHAADTTSHVVTGASGTLKLRRLDFTSANYPVLVTDYATVSASATLAANDGGNIRFQFYDTANTGAVIQSSEKTVVGKRPEVLGWNVFDFAGHPYWLPHASFWRDWKDQAIFSAVGGTFNGQLLTPGGAHLDRYGRLVAWPSGATSVRINIGWNAADSELGERELLMTGVTKDNYGLVWTIENIAGSGISVNTTTAGPNGGVLITYANNTFSDTYISLLSLPAPITQFSLRRTNDAHPEWLLNDDFIAFLTICGIPRWMWFGLEGFSAWQIPLPGKVKSPPDDMEDFFDYRDNFPTWSTRRMIGFRPEVLIEAANRANVPLQMQWTANVNDDYVTGFANLCSLTLDPTIPVLSALQNEIWGDHGCKGFMFIKGWERGFAGSSPDRIARTINVRAGMGSTPVVGNYADGALLANYMYGISWDTQLFRARHAITGPTTLPTGGVGDENADWTCISSSEATGGTRGPNAIWRWQGVRLAEIITILRSKLGSRATLAAEGFALDGTVSGTDEATTVMLQQLTFPAIAGGPRLIDVVQGRLDYGIAPYWPQVTFSLSTSPGNMTPGATRQDGIKTALETNFGADPNNFATALENFRSALARAVSTAYTLNGTSVRYNPADSHVGSYEFNMDLLYADNDDSLKNDGDAVVRSAAIETLCTNILAATIEKHGGNWRLFTMGPRYDLYHNFGVLSKVPPNFASLQRGREKIFVEKAQALAA